MKFGLHQPRPDASFDLTAMIDVILLLIVFFMLSSQFSRMDQLQVRLPAEQGERIADEENPSEVVISIDDLGRLHTQGHQVELAQLGAVLGVRESGPPAGLRVYVRADRSASARHLNAVAGELARLGVRTWQLGTEPPGAPARAGGGS